MKLEKNTLGDQLIVQADEDEDIGGYNFRERQQFEFNSNTINHHQHSHTNPHQNTIAINYDQIIDMQSSMIQALYKQCTLLRQYAQQLQEKQKLLQTINIDQNNNSKQSNEGKQQQSLDQLTKIIQSSILKQISTALNMPQQEVSRAKVIQAIKRLQWERQKRLQPIFIESKTQVRIPVPVEVVVEKIVYKDRIVVQEVPVFREKVVERFEDVVVVKDNDNAASYNKARSPRNYYNNNSNKQYTSPRQSYQQKSTITNTISNQQQPQQRFYKSNKFNNPDPKYQNQQQYYQNQQLKPMSKHPSTKTLLKNHSNKTLYYQTKQHNSNKRNYYYDGDGGRR